MSETKLKRCPFCGEDLVKIGGTWYYHKHNGCVLGGFRFKSDDKERLSAWNTRIPMQNIVERLKEKSMLVATSKEFWNNPQNGEYTMEVVPFQDAIEIVKEEGDISDQSL